MRIKTLKRYQEQAVANGRYHMDYARQQYDALLPEAGIEQREGIASHQGCLLLEAPTGSGKTLIAAHLIEAFSEKERVVWFWFAPFKGVTGQTVSFLKEQSAGLRVRDLTQDRQISGSRAGDVFVTTWQTVAVKSKDQRKARQDGEMAPGVDSLVAGLRKMGLRIGIVVDEAHHSFQGQSQAAAFYREVLAPEYTVLITATPDDKDITKWKEACGIAKVHRIAVSRADAVEAGLVKEGVKCISFIPDPASEGLVDLEMTCLRCATGVQADLKEKLREAGVSLTPLLMVQVDSKKKDSVARAKAQLMQCGFPEEAIATHTAEEPDSGLMGLANNEKVEVLIFKMAVALGFDAPRAFTLVSMRAAKDEDFGVQLLGRILRVHRRLQGKTVPDALKYGYVLLANPEGQSGLKAAGERMNALKTEMDKTSPTVAVMCVGGVHGLQLLGKGGETHLFPGIWRGPTPGGTGSIRPNPTRTQGGEGWEPGELELDGGTTIPVIPERDAETSVGPPPGLVKVIVDGRENGLLKPAAKYRYPLKPGVPRRFLKMSIPDDVETLDEDCAKYFLVEGDAILTGLVTTVQVERRTLEVFTGQMMLEFSKADLSKAEVARRASELLFENANFHAKDLRELLLVRLTKILEEKGLMELSSPDKVKHLLNTMLVAQPGLLKEAQKKAVSQHATVVNAADLPEAMEFDGPVLQSARNVYGIYPPGLGSWEQDFAQSLDRASGNIIQWWHRNEVKKPHSVSVILANGASFYPDFVIQVQNRARQGGILLADPKDRWEQEREHDKILAEHPSYGRALILQKSGQYSWQPIVWDQKLRKPVLAGTWSWENAAGW